MNLAEELLREPSNEQASPIVRYIGNDPDRFGALMEVFFGGPYRLTQRAARVMNYCVEAYPALIIPHLELLIAFSRQPRPDAVKRNTLRLLQYVDIPAQWQGEVIDLCFTMLGNAGEAVAIKAFAMTVAGNICRQHPDLVNELVFLIETQLPYQSAAFRSRGRKFLGSLRTPSR
jgi:hypothetical protein